MTAYGTSQDAQPAKGRQTKQHSLAHDLSSAACLPASAHPGEEKEASRQELGEVGGKERGRGRGSKKTVSLKLAFPAAEATPDTSALRCSWE